KTQRPARLSVEPLEDRRLMAAFAGSLLSIRPPTDAPIVRVQSTSPSPVLTTPADEGLTATSVFQEPTALSPSAFESVIGASRDTLLATVPALSSNPGASHTLYLNFGGDYRDSWSGKDRW